MQELEKQLLLAAVSARSRAESLKLRKLPEQICPTKFVTEILGAFTVDTAVSMSHLSYVTLCMLLSCHDDLFVERNHFRLRRIGLTSTCVLLPFCVRLLFNKVCTQVVAAAKSLALE